MHSDSSSTAPPVVIVTGPTAGGKTPLAIDIATAFGGEIVNADSMQVYRYMDIGTAKATLEQRARVRHHLLDVVTPDVPYSAGRYAGEARAAATAIHARGKIVVLTGGSGLYIRAFLEGILDAGSADLELRAALESEYRAGVAAGDPDCLHRRLTERDPVAGARIHPNDLRRVIRALEIGERRGRAASMLRDDHAFADRPYRTLHLAIDPGRDTIDARIEARCRAMIEGGLLQEVRALRERGYGPELRPLHAIGYRHLGPVVDGADTLVNARAAMERDTRRFARRQRTWLRAVANAVWMRPDDRAEILRRVESFLAVDQ